MSGTFWATVASLPAYFMEDFNTRKRPESSHSLKTKTLKLSYQQLPWEWDWILSILIALFTLTWQNHFNHMCRKLVVLEEGKTEHIVICSWTKATSWSKETTYLLMSWKNTQWKLLLTSYKKVNQPLNVKKIWKMLKKIKSKRKKWRKSHWKKWKELSTEQ